MPEDTRYTPNAVGANKAFKILHIPFKVVIGLNRWMIFRVVTNFIPMAPMAIGILLFIGRKFGVEDRGNESM